MHQPNPGSVQQFTPDTTGRYAVEYGPRSTREQVIGWAVVVHSVKAAPYDPALAHVTTRVEPVILRDGQPTTMTGLAAPVEITADMRATGTYPTTDHVAWRVVPGRAADQPKEHR